MSEEGDKSLDILGAKPVARAIERFSGAAVDGVGAFLSRICLPAAEEFGFLLRDKVSGWRTQNTLNVASKAKVMIEADPSSDGDHAHPRVVCAILESGSWTDDDQMQSMWAALLANSCNGDGTDQGNTLFINILQQLMPTEARLLKWSVENSKVRLAEGGWLDTDEIIINLKLLRQITGLNDPQRIDREIDHMRSLGLLTEDSGFDLDSTDAIVEVAALGLVSMGSVLMLGHDGPLERAPAAAE